MWSESLKKRARLIFRVVALSIIASSMFIIITATPVARMLSGAVGSVAAHFDIYLGRLEVISCSGGSDCRGQFRLENDPVELEYERILYDRYGIGYRKLCGRGTNPVLGEWIVGYAQGYTLVSFKAIEKKFGLGIFQEANREALGKFGKIC